jgi:membrane associated rhomboid family serine protease
MIGRAARSRVLGAYFLSFPHANVLARHLRLLLAHRAHPALVVLGLWMVVQI